MDNLCHTLAGAALAHAGLKRTTRFSAATLMLASNLPDLDVLVFATEIPAVAFRRGWTHGVMAQALLPALLAAVMYLAGRRARDRPGAPPLSFRALLLLSYTGVVAHVGMDLLNNYGVRLLMPFSGRWFYGDSVFIVDPWLWLTLAAGILLARWRERTRPARLALLLAAAYIAAMVVSARAARELVRQEWAAHSGREPRALMVGPVPVVPWRRAVIVDGGAALVTGSFTWLPLTIAFDPNAIPKRDDHPSVRAAVAADARLRAVLTWARFPYYAVESTPHGDVVTLRDLRFGERVGQVRVVVAASASSADRTGRSQ